MIRHDTVNDESMISKKRSGREIFSRVFAYLRRYPWYGVGTMLCAIITTVAGLAFPKLTQVMVDEAILKRRMDLVLWMGGGLLLAGDGIQRVAGLRHRFLARRTGGAGG